MMSFFNLTLSEKHFIFPSTQISAWLEDSGNGTIPPLPSGPFSYLMSSLTGWKPQTAGEGREGCSCQKQSPQVTHPRTARPGPEFTDTQGGLRKSVLAA